ncbi:glycosyltransferase family 4 protein [Salidesulfovibrio onnuriiensis]|uniref:glycosyltransferase family 4 protein n=1 Tax=Salidesulfovibrio onnuriiensis TaxID=2583823 RepID=UPI0011C8E30D|nr:glycosyltransferase family 4 protein [Salidesulfovibrio onnuriiensis]
MARSILFLTSSDTSSQSLRFRVDPLVSFGEKRGLNVRRVVIPDNFMNRLAFFRFLPMADICVLHRELLAGRELACLRKKYPVLAYDFDCAVWTLPASELDRPGGMQRAAKRAERFGRQCSMADICIAGNIFLARKADEFSRQVSVLPTGVDTDVYLPRLATDASRPLHVGWVGSAAAMDNVRAVLGRLQSLGGLIQFQVVSDQPYAGPCQEYVFWEKREPARAVGQLHGMDIGLLPLPGDEHSQGDCGLTLLQFMSCAMPPVVSSVGVCREIIDHGIDGFLVDDPNEWEKYVMHLVDDPSLRGRIGEAGREKLCSRYDVASIAELLWEVLDV